MSILNKIKLVDFPLDQYYQTVYPKTQIYLHHTVSGEGAMGDINYWKSNREHVATCIVLQRDGVPYQLFSSKYYGYHLGLDVATFTKLKLPYKDLDTTSIAVEIDSWGGLQQHTDGKWYPSKRDNVTKKLIPNTSIKAIENVTLYPKGFRGFYAFESYTPEQIQSLKELLILWKERYKIPLTYNEDMWDISKKALSNTPGIWSHTSVRKDKSDVHPQPELITMLKSL